MTWETSTVLLGGLPFTVWWVWVPPPGLSSHQNHKKVPLNDLPNPIINDTLKNGISHWKEFHTTSRILA
jgi:hypothetical protein